MLSMISPKQKLTLIVLFAALLSATAFADDLGGRTSNGCTYKVINGQYLYDCSGKAPQQVAASAPAAPAQAIAAPSPNSSDYMAQQAQAMQAQQQQVPVQVVAPPPTLTFNVAPPADQSKAVANDESDSATSRYKTKRNSYNRDRYYDATYVGASIGGNTITAANAGSSTGAGISIGTNLDDFLGIELGYSYTKVDTNLNLNSRSGTPIANAAATDSSLSAHLLSAEIQFHLTDTFKRLRPYAGLGLGWKHSTLTDNGSAATYAYGASSGGSLSQNSLGAIASLGTKFRFSDAWQAAVAFRYYLPVSNQNASLDTPVQNSAIVSGNRLSQADSNLTSSSLYQLVGGVQYSF